MQILMHKSQLNLSVLGKNRRRIRGEIANVAVGGARIRFQGDDAPSLATGDHIVLAFASAQHEFGGNVLAKVISTSEDSAEKIVQLAFDERHEPLKPWT